MKPEDYINIISSIKDESALAIVMIDLVDFPCSIFPNLAEILGKNRPVFLVGNKIDLIPKDHPSYLDHVKNCLHQEAMRMGFEENSIKHVALISATTGYGIEELITKLHSIWRYNGNVYLIGCTNVGKSSLFNALLSSDFCKVNATNVIQRATASPWPGTTLRMLKFPILRPSDKIVFERTRRLLAERSAKHQYEAFRREKAADTKSSKYATLKGFVGMTFRKIDLDAIDPAAQNQQSGFKAQLTTLKDNFNRYKMSKWCFDTPGVMHTDQILQMLTTDEIIKVLPKKMIQPRVFYISSGMSVFIAGLARLDCVDIPIPTRIIIYSSLRLPISICKTKDAADFYESFLGSEILGVPMNLSEERLEKWPPLEARYDDIIVEGEDKYVSACDFVMSSVGWIGINLPKNCKGTFKPWTIEKRGFYVRKPALLPNGWELRGQRVRDSPAYRIGNAFTFRRNPKRKNKFIQ
jgi:nitric oxide-associated protein 1